MERNRMGESGVTPFRTGRFFYVDSAWYFSCREGMDHGPFANKADAESALGEFLENLGVLDEIAKAAGAS